MRGEPITERELNRALLARQGLLDRVPGPLPAVVDAAGALQMQYWPALLPALWSRTFDCPPGAPYDAHAEGVLVTGRLMRGTIHTMSAAAFPALAAVTAESRVMRGWMFAGPRPPGADELVADLVSFAAQPRTIDQVAEFAEEWVARRPGVFGEAELAHQREFRWRPLCSAALLVRAPADGRWGSATPTAYQAGPVTTPPPVETALDEVVRRHLGAFGPAGADDVASWIGWPVTPVRAALRRLADLAELAVFADETGRALYDLPPAPRPGADADPPVRLLPWYDSVLLGYAPKRRGRILPEAYKDAVFLAVNGRIQATYLLDGMVAGTWAVERDRRAATVVLRPLRPLARGERAALLEEAERLAAVVEPGATAHRATITG